MLPVRVTATGLEDVIDLRKTVAIYDDPSADLALGASVDPVVPTETFTYTLDVGNTSAGALTNTTLTAYLPAGVTVDTISNGGSEASTGVVVWSLGSVGAGAVLSRQVTVEADSASEGDILKLSAELSHDGGLEQDNETYRAKRTDSAVEDVIRTAIQLCDKAAKENDLTITVEVEVY